jgi:hypothetical protein
MLAAVSLPKDEVETEIDAITSHAYALFSAYLGLGSFGVTISLRQIRLCQMILFRLSGQNVQVQV